MEYNLKDSEEELRNAEENEKAFKLPELQFPEKLETKRTEIMKYMRAIEVYRDQYGIDKQANDTLFPKSLDRKRVTFNLMNQNKFNCEACIEEKNRYQPKMSNPFTVDYPTASWDELAKTKVCLDSSNMNFQQGLDEILKLRPRRFKVK